MKKLRIHTSIPAYNLDMFPYGENNNATLSNPKLNFSLQNVRSLNISTKNAVTDQKILALTGGSGDVVFLSDLRLNSQKQIASCAELTKKIFLRGYKFFHNSISSLRGVGILIKKQVMENLVVHNIVRDTECNYIILDAEFGGKRMSIGAVYGVNKDEGIRMYADLERDLLQLKNKEIILGGDWNGTWDNSTVERNIDVLNMVNIPSLRRSNAIISLANNLSMTDPYRIIYPDTREYTFIPSGLNQQNRSRLDFFLISRSLCEQVVNVIIPHSLSSTVFDHKPVHLIFERKKNSFKHFIKDNFIDDLEFQTAIHIAVVECYIIHATNTHLFSEAEKNRILLHIGTLTTNLHELQQLKISEAQNGASELLTLQIEGKRGEIRLNMENLPTLDFLDSLALDPDPSIFMETLILCIKNNALQEQKRIGTVGNITKDIVISRLKILKTENVGNRNSAQIIREDRLLL